MILFSRSPSRNENRRERVNSTRKHVLIIGGGFGGVAAARRLANSEVDVTVVDRTNHHVFQPLLYQVATATLAPSDIAVPIRWLTRKHARTEVLLGEVTGIDVERRVARIDELERDVPYDFLILASGARHSYFGHDDWEHYAPGLKSLDDARDIRQRLLMAFEEAERSEDDAERAACLTIVVIGGGPTGVELAGIIPDITHHAFPHDFRHIDTTRTRVVLVEAGPRLLAAFPGDLARRAHRDLEELGVEVRTGTMVTRVEDGVVHLGDERIAARTVLWAAGNAASPLARMLGVPVDRAGRVIVEPDLSIPGHPEVFVAGDAAASEQADGTLAPAVAPTANPMGAHAADQILRTLRHQERRPFRFRNKGNLATIGRYKAIADFGRLRLTGRLAWWFWLFVHILYLAGFRNRLSVLVEWGYAYFTYERGSRLIIGRGRGLSRKATVPQGPEVTVPQW